MPASLGRCGEGCEAKDLREKTGAGRMELMERMIRWGIVGPGDIARRLAAEWPLIDGACLAGVASRDLSRAEAYARDFGMEKAYGSYDELFEEPGIDIVYIAVPHNFHRGLALRAMEAGKAVFCEKPMGVNAAEVKEMAETARKRGIFLMEAVKTRFMPAVLRAQEWVAEGRIGKPGLLEAHFCLDIGGNPWGRHLNPDLAGGAVLDLAVYPLTLAEMLLGKSPVETRVVATKTKTGVDGTTAITLRYASGAIAQLTVSVAMGAGTYARLWGSEGNIEIPGFNQPESVVLHAAGTMETFRQEKEGVFRFEVGEANRCLREGLGESPVMSLEDSLRMARWQDEILAQVAEGG